MSISKPSVVSHASDGIGLPVGFEGREGGNDGEQQEEEEEDVGVSEERRR